METAVSRIFVRGLPPTITDEDFKSHFARRYTVTDTKLLARRRIGYVGFRTSQDALSAVKYFNKSFIRMSKIGVELADNTLHAAPGHPTARKSTGETADTLEKDGEAHKVINPLKRKRPEPTKDDSKLQEYLGLMTAPSKLKTWRDGEQPAADIPDSTANQPTQAEQTPPETVDDTAVLPRKKPAALTSDDEDADIPAAVKTRRMAETAPEDDKHDQDNEQGPPPGTSDMDWMRSRTSRLLGLVTDDVEDSDQEQDKKKSRAVSPELEKGGASTKPAVEANAQMNIGPNASPADAPPAENKEEVNADVATIRKTGRLFLRNLAYTITEDEIREYLSAFGSLEEVHVPQDSKSGDSKGFAFVQFEDHEEAVEAYEQIDGNVFQGRLVHAIAASGKRENKLDEFALSKLPLKKQRQIQKKSEAPSSTFSWNALYMNPDAVMSSIAARLGMAKSEVFDPTSSDAGVKQAQAETHIIQETKSYFAANGVDLDAFASRDRGDTTILVKNFPYGTTAEELRKLFEETAKVLRVLMPPSGTIAIVELAQATQARAAFSSLAYRKFKDSILFLEKGPKNLFSGVPSNLNDAATTVETKLSTTELKNEAGQDVDTTTLFVRNLNFTTTQAQFSETFRPLDGFVSARIKTKTDPKQPGRVLSMGFGFLEFISKDQARAALAAMDGYTLEGHALVIKASHKGLDAAEERRKEDQSKRNRERKSKLIVKNLPFEATKKDVQNLFKSYGQLRAVRLPKKFDNSRKGYAFAEFMTPKEAENAMDALRNTHLLGRRLVIDYATVDVEDPEKEIARMQQKVGRQVNNIAMKKLTEGSDRRKVNIGNLEGEEE